MLPEVHLTRVMEKVKKILSKQQNLVDAIHNHNDRESDFEYDDF